MTALGVVLAAAGDVPQDPWPFVIIGYIIMGLGLIAVAVQTVVRGRRLSQRVPAGQRRWLDSRALHAEGAAPAGSAASPTGSSAGGAERADAP
jgi:hypothetical protein